MGSHILSDETVEVRRAVVNCLVEADVCTMCVLRFLGVKLPSAYASVSSAQRLIDEIYGINDLGMSDQGTAEPASKRPKTSGLCVACLGMLTDLCDDNSMANITKCVVSAGYDATTFLFSVSVPATLQIRHFSMLLHLKQCFPSVYATEMTIDDFTSVKEIWKWTLGPIMESRFNMDFQINGGLNVTINIVYDDDELECNCLKLFQTGEPTKKKRRQGWSRAAVEKLLFDANLESFKKSGCPCPPSTPSKGCWYGPVTCQHAPLYVAGRYSKYSRKLSQTPWLVDGERITETSIQDLICDPIREEIPYDDIVFSASGREDVDVRTLGKGRPFILQIQNPKRTRLTQEHIRALQEKINKSTSDIEVRHLQIISKDETTRLKEGEEEKIKSYMASCYATDPIDQIALDRLNVITELELRQKTPIRVLHRRTAAVRKKVVHAMRADLVDEHHFNLHLITQAGTYIKEFVHGDFGRTVPNLRTLLANEVDILELDVQSIELDWPPEV